MVFTMIMNVFSRPARIAWPRIHVASLGRCSAWETVSSFSLWTPIMSCTIQLHLLCTFLFSYFAFLSWASNRMDVKHITPSLCPNLCECSSSYLQYFALHHFPAIWFSGLNSMPLHLGDLLCPPLIGFRLKTPWGLQHLVQLSKHPGKC